MAKLEKFEEYLRGLLEEPGEEGEEEYYDEEAEYGEEEGE